LRTKKQFGYIVFVKKYTIENIPGIVYVIQTTNDINVVNWEINNFIKNQKNIILNDENIELQKKKLYSEYWNIKNFFEIAEFEFSKFYDCIDLNNDEILNIIKNIWIEKMEDVYNAIFTNNNLTIIIENNEIDAEKSLIDNINIINDTRKKMKTINNLKLFIKYNNSKKNY